MDCKSIMLFCLILFGQESYTSNQGYTFGLNNSSSSAVNYHYNPANYKVIEFSNLTISTDYGLSLFQLGYCAITYFSVQNRRFRKKRNEFDKEYGKKYASFFKHQMFLNQEQFCVGRYELAMNPLFEQFQFYRFPGFQKALFEDENYENSILAIEKNLQYMSDYQLKPSGYHKGELEQIIHALANDVREGRKIEEQLKRERKAAAERRALELRLEEEKKARIKQQQKNEYRESVIKVMQDPESQVAAYSEMYQEIDYTQLSVHERRKIILQRREEALSRFNRKCDQWQEDSFRFLDKAQKLLNEQSVRIADYITCFGNAIQRTLHQEMVTIIHDTADLRYVEDDYTHERESVATTILRFIQTGNLYNREGQIGKTFSCIDFCWGLLDCQTYVLNTMIQTSVDISQVAVALTKGAVRGGLNVVFKMGQPIRTLSDFADEVAYLIALTGEHLQYAHDERKKTFQRMRAQIDLDEYNLSIGAVTQAGLMRRDFNYFKSSCNQTIVEVDALLKHTWQSLNRENVLFGVEKVSEMGTEMFLTSKATQAVSTLLKNGSMALDGIVEAGDGAKKLYNLPLNSNTLEAYIGYEASIADIRAASVVATKNAAAKAAAVLKKASKITPVVALSNTGPGGSGPNNPVSGTGNILNSPKDALEATPKFSDAEISQLMSKHDGQRFHKGHPVTFRYKYIWEGQIYASGIDFGGLHHDHLGILRKQGYLRITKMDPSGFYEAEVFVGGKWVRSSFFPESWSHDQVMQCIFDIYDRKKIFDADGIRTVLEDVFVNNVKIRIVLEDLTGRCITFYPRL